MRKKVTRLGLVRKECACQARSEPSQTDLLTKKLAYTRRIRPTCFGNTAKCGSTSSVSERTALSATTRLRPTCGRYQLCDGEAFGRGGEAPTGGLRPRGRSPHCHWLRSVADLDRLLANRDAAWSLMVDLQLDVESQLESRLAAAVLPQENYSLPRRPGE